jgi:hypothetical protein
MVETVPGEGSGRDSNSVTQWSSNGGRRSPTGLLVVSAVGVALAVAVAIAVTTGSVPGVSAVDGDLPAVDKGVPDLPVVDGDTDGDGLSDDRERRLGTDPTRPDTDGDRLPDGWEVDGRTPEGAALPDADPTRKDLYVQVGYGDRVDPLTADEKRRFERTWATMPILNPDGSTGVTVHLDDTAPRGGPYDRRVTLRGERTREELLAGFYTEASLGPRRCVYHLAVLGAVRDGPTAGYGDAPGHLVLIDGTVGPRPDGELSPRIHYLTHELLHNVVGQFADGRYHTDDGWLAAHTGDAGHFLSNVTRDRLDGTGFADAPRYRPGVCD